MIGPISLPATWQEFEQPLPFPNTKQIINLDFDNFKNSKLKEEWTWNYISSDMQYEIKNGKLHLSGTSKKTIIMEQHFVCVLPQPIIL